MCLPQLKRAFECHLGQSELALLKIDESEVRQFMAVFLARPNSLAIF